MNVGCMIGGIKKTSLWIARYGSWYGRAVNWGIFFLVGKVMEQGGMGETQRLEGRKGLGPNVVQVLIGFMILVETLVVDVVLVLVLFFAACCASGSGSESGSGSGSGCGSGSGLGFAACCGSGSDSSSGSGSGSGTGCRTGAQGVT